MTDTDRIYTASEVAEKLQVSKETVMRKLRKGELRGFKVGRLWRITAEGLEEYKINRNRI
jgi:excisionase family DNA binding protein